MDYYVYKLVDPRTNKIFYVGKGCKKRMYEHVKNVQRGRIPNNNRHLYHKIKQILDLGLKITYKKLFFTKNEQQAYNKEKELITKIGLKTLCNITSGGEGNSQIIGAYIGRKHSDRTKEKISIARKGQKLSEETKKKISSALKGRIHTKTARKKLSYAHKGKILSKEHRKKISESMKGRIPWNKKCLQE